MKRILALLAATTALFIIGASAALAATIEIPINTVVRADEGSTTVIGTYDTPSELVGEKCAVSARAKNQSSVHPKNDLIVSSGGGSITLADVERAANVVTSGSGSLTLGATITVSLRMGPDELFSGGITVTAECPPPTTTTTSSTTTTTEPPTTTTTTTVPESTTTTSTPVTKPPVIQIEKTATPEEYGEDGIGYFTIKVTNPGPVDLTDVHVTDDVARAIDPTSNCVNDNVPDLAVGEGYTYECSIANLDGVSPFTNEATAIGTGPDGTKVTDTDDATVFPPVLATTITTVPPTLPVTGVPFEQVRGFSVAGISFFFAGIALLGAAAWIGRHRVLEALGYEEFWLPLQPMKSERTFYITLRPADRDRDRSED